MTPGSASGVTALCATCADTILATRSSKSGLDGTLFILGRSTEKSLQTADVGLQPDAAKPWSPQTKDFEPTETLGSIFSGLREAAQFRQSRRHGSRPPL